MGDDGIAVLAVEKISSNFKSPNVEFVIGETDMEYCIDYITEKDFLIIIDAVYFGNIPGEISVISLEKAKTNKPFSQHELSLVNLLTLYNKENKGIIIGIEIYEICFSNNISQVLRDSFDNICTTLKEIIYLHSDF